MTENLEKVLCFAPGEDNIPLGIFMDTDSEFLAFPTIFCGETRPDNKDRKIPDHYSTVCKWELRRQDRRVAQLVYRTSFISWKSFKANKFKIVHIWFFESEEPKGFCSRKRQLHILKIRGSRLVEKKEQTDYEVNKMTWQQKSDLIQNIVESPLLAMIGEIVEGITSHKCIILG